MEIVISFLLVIVAGLPAIPISILLLETVAAIALPQWVIPSRATEGSRNPIAVLVPAHNESSGILLTLADIQNQTLPGDRLLVIADNCSDDTAAVAIAAGAEVIERNDCTRYGKGYALDYGIRHLESDPPEIIIVVDADCRLADGAIDCLIRTCATTGQPVQALYLMTAPVESQINQQVAEFAWRVKNWLRPLGLRTLRLPCQLMGTGMAFPWIVIQAADLCHGHLVEDLKLGLDLTLAGHPPLFCPSALVTSQFASSLLGSETQHTRWEVGHIDTILKAAPKLIETAVRLRNLDLFALVLDMTVPPLSILAILIFATFGLTGLARTFGHFFAPFAISASTLSVFMLVIFLAWIKCGRDVLPPRALALIVGYIIKKLRFYFMIVPTKIDSRWIRTDRTK